MDTRVHKLLYSIGLTANYVGYRQMMIALKIAAEEPETLCMVTKRLYPETARRCGTNWKAVERNIRTAIRCTWNNSQHTLRQMTGYSLDDTPKPAQFLAILVNGLQMSSDFSSDSFLPSNALTADNEKQLDDECGDRGDGMNETGSEEAF